MTAETLKPFLNLPNATADELKARCAQKSTVKRGLVALGCILAAALCCALIGVQIWHLNKTAALQQEVDDLKMQLYQRAREFTDYEFDNDLFDNADEYAYEPEEDLDQDVSDDGHREQETNDSGLMSSGMQDEEMEDNEERENLGLEDLRETNEDDDIIIDDSVDTSVPGGIRRARSISGVTRQGVPIVDEPYVPRRNRTRHPHRIYEQLRQRPEELVTPPPSGEMFRWDVENRKTHTASRQQSYGSISIRPYQHEIHNHREHHSTTPMPVAYGSRVDVRHHSRNELNAGNPTKPPAPMLNRMSRVQATGETMRKQLQQTQRFPKVVGNPGTQKEIVMAPESRVRLRQRKTGAAQSGEPLAKGVHLVKQSSSGVFHRNTRHRDWTAKDDASKQAIQSGQTFAFDGEQLTVNEPGLYYVYAQVTYSNEYDTNGFKVLVGDKKHLSCSVHSRGENTNTCFTAGITEIPNHSTTIAIEDVDHGRQHVMYPEKTFFGVFKIGRLPQTGAVRHRSARKVV
ncbi:protein eiger [Anopheles marshallii]|uniref:protein eiger n=1 Tax=Anopheles marshallii TaxID=1521116 RepID=UPI00237AE73B|nr:protein eiger [Anopheles marshallii]